MLGVVWLDSDTYEMGAYPEIRVEVTRIAGACPADLKRSVDDLAGGAGNPTTEMSIGTWAILRTGDPSDWATYMAFKGDLMIAVSSHGESFANSFYTALALGN